MKISIIDPHILLGSFMNNGAMKYNIHGYILEFIKKYKPNIYLTKMRDYLKLLKLFKYIGEDVGKFEIFCLSKKSLYNQTDVLLYMNGSIYSDISLFKQFEGLKLYHIMDPQYLAKDLNKFLINAGINYLLGYNSYDKHSKFVRTMYPNFKDKIIGIPFGFAPVWKALIPFEQRENKALLTGTMETFENVRKSDYYEKVYDYYMYFSDKHNSMHEIRFLIDQNKMNYLNYIDIKIHHWPTKTNFVENIVGEFNKYKFFINDESLLNFCPIRTYEGIAAGCVMICHAATCYDEWEFKDNLNCIKFNKLEEIIWKMEHYLNNKEILNKIQSNGFDYITNNFNHAAVADSLYEKIETLYLTRQ